MALNIQIFSDNRLFPQVFNIVQGTNKVDTVVFTMENYIVNEKDLSTYDWYAHLMGVEGIDAVKLTSAIVDGKLQITFDLTEYVTQLGNTLTYQIVAKDDISSVWNSGKGVILNAESIPADDKIVADYPSILRQWELRLEEMAGSLDTAIYYIAYGETLPKEKRVAGRLYYQYLYAENSNGQLEDSNGNILIPEPVAKNIGITAIDDLTAETVQEALEALKVMIENKDSLPAQAGNGGKFLKTNGESAEWAEVEALPEQDDQDGKFLKSVNGKAEWADAPRGLPLLSIIWADHKLNDASYLRADNFSWHSGDVYVAAYEHLAEDSDSTSSNKAIINGAEYYAWGQQGSVYYTKSKTPTAGDDVYTISSNELISSKYVVVSSGDSSIVVENVDRGTTSTFNKYLFGSIDIIGNIVIEYHTAKDGHKICLPDQESKIMDLYEATGAADYYLLDTDNKQFKLPRKQKRKLIQAVKSDDGTWYNLYSDGWVEQGGLLKNTSQNISSVTFPVEMADANYTIIRVQHQTSSIQSSIPGWTSGTESRTTTGFTYNSTATSVWQVSGYAAESAYASAGMQLEYYYVGNYIRNMTEIDVGALTELINNGAPQLLNNLGTTSGTATLTANKIYSGVISGDLVFVLPSDVNTSYFNQIKVMAKIVGTPTISWGTTYFVNKEAPTIEEGHYDFYFDYDNNLGGWVLGAITKGA